MRPVHKLIFKLFHTFVKKGLQKAIMGTATTVLGCHGYPRNSLNSHIWVGFDGHYCSLMIWVPSQIPRIPTYREDLMAITDMIQDGIKTLCKYYLKTLLSNRYISYLDVPDLKSTLSQADNTRSEPLLVEKYRPIMMTNSLKTSGFSCRVQDSLRGKARQLMGVQTWVGRLQEVITFFCPDLGMWSKVSGKLAIFSPLKIEGEGVNPMSEKLKT